MHELNNIQTLRDYISEQQKIKLSQEQILWLFRKDHSRRTDKEIQQLINANLPMVYKIADGFFQKHKLISTKTVEFCDLFQAGVLGLTTAIEKFDSFRGTKFSTFAYYYISLEVRNEVNRLIYPLKKYYYADIKVKSVDESNVNEIEYKSENNPAYNDILETAKAILSEELNAIFLMYFHEKFTMAEISKELGVSTSKIQYSVGKIRKQLQQVLTI